jgi:hypothetical protein
MSVILVACAPRVKIKILSKEEMGFSGLFRLGGPSTGRSSRRTRSFQGLVAPVRANELQLSMGGRDCI